MYRVCSSQAFFYLTQGPVIVVDYALHRFVDNRLCIAPLLLSDPVKLGLELRGKVYFHAAIV